MGAIIIGIFGLLTAAGFAFMLFSSVAKRRHATRDVVRTLEAEVTKRNDLKGAIQALYSEMVPVGQLQKAAEEIRSSQEALKAERGRIMITQAELETVESRLRELEEIEREFDASGLETKQELGILQKKREEIATKNNAVKDQINLNAQQIDQLLGEIKMSAEMQAQIQNMKTELVRSQEKIETLLMQIEQSNEQYALAKRRYDALDIEYAQLYEKYSESGMSSGEEE